MNNNLRYITTAFSFFVCAFLFYRTTKGNQISSSKEGEKKKKILNICSILLIILGAACLSLIVIPDEINWNKENDKNYTAWIDKNTKISIIQSNKDLLCESELFFDYQKKRLIDDNFTVNVNILKQNDIKKINRYIKSLSKQTGLSGCFVLFKVEKSNNNINQNIYIFNIHEMKIEYSEYYIKSRKNKKE